MFNGCVNTHGICRHRASKEAPQGAGICSTKIQIMISRKVLCAGLLLASGVWYACDNEKDTRHAFDAGDREFVTRASQSNRAEIELGQLAVTQSEHTEVQAYGQRMISAHEEAENDLDNLAHDNNIVLSNDLGDAHEERKDRLMNLEGYSFDTAFMNIQIAAHEESIALYERQASSGPNELRKYVDRYLPEIRMHAEDADSLYVVLVQGDTTQSDTTASRSGF